MSASLGRIGRALLKFFKPLRVTLPHLPNGTAVSEREVPTASIEPKLVEQTTSPPAASLPATKPSPPGEFPAPQQAPECARAPHSPVITEERITPADASEPALDPKTHWLDLVVYLLAACRRASDKTRHRSGLNTYQKALMSRGKGKLRAVGNIIDTEPSPDAEAKSEKDRESA